MTASLTFAAFIVYTLITLAIPKPVILTVRPFYALAPATLTLHARVPRHSENRWLRLEANDQQYITDIQLAGEAAETLYTREWRHVAAGRYQIAAGVFSATALRGMDRVSVTVY